MVPGDGEQRRPERAQEARRVLLLTALGAVGEVAAGDDQLRLDALDEGCEPELDVSVVTRSEMQVGHVENPGCHDRGRL